jgi:epoxide hydrolase 4
MNKISFDYAQIGGVKLHYAKAGNGERLVILLHGFPEFWYSWRHQLENLSDEFTVVAPDLRGFNLSDKPAAISDYKLEILIDDVLGLIHHFGRESVALVGHDWGAGIAWTLASRFPEAVEKIACLQVPPLPVWQKNLSFRQALASWYMFFFQIPRLPEWFLSLNNYAVGERLFRNAAGNPDFFSDEEMEKFKESWRETDALASAINYYRANAMNRFFVPIKENKITSPSLFIYGEKDTAVLPSTVENVHEFIDAPYTEVRIPDAGHWVQQEASEEVTDVLREFLAEEN